MMICIRMLQFHKENLNKIKQLKKLNMKNSRINVHSVQIAKECKLIAIMNQKLLRIFMYKKKLKDWRKVDKKKKE